MTKLEAREHNKRVAAKLCQEHGCEGEDEHFDMIVNRAWNPHPSAEFVAWWKTQPEYTQDGVGAILARNCKVFCDRFKEARKYGIV